MKTNINTMIDKIFFSTIFLFLIAAKLIAQPETQVVYLSGTGFKNTVEWDFFCSNGANSGTWSKIDVPSQWELEGFGEYTYGRWYRQKGVSPSMETGHYKTTFTAPQSWKGQNITLVFEGVMTDTKVTINGKQAGDIHQGGFYRFSYPLSELIQYNAENTLEVFVSKHSEDKTVNAAERMADWWLFGGIYRPVYLEIKPAEHIAQLKVDPKADGSFTGYVRLSEVNAKAKLRATLSAVNGKTFPAHETSIAEGSTEAVIEAKWDNIAPWTPETPNLYHITIELIRNGKTVHQITERIGFRTIEVRPQDGIYCNGTKILMKGVNRHTFWPESGRCTNREISLMDAKLIKEMNMNAIRSHYPPDPHFLDMCDSLGLFYIDELAGWQNAYRTEIGEKLIKEMVNRDVNHPCVILWSNGNEGGWNEENDHLFQFYDPQKRDVIHPWADFNNIDTHHYPQYQTGIHRFTNGYKIFMPGEFMHGLYDEGHGSGLDDFWAQYKNHPLCAGGFVWAYNDDAVVRADWPNSPDSLDSDGQHAPDGIVGPFREKEASFYVVKEIWAPVQFKKIYITPSFNGEMVITNEYLYTNLNQCQMTYKVTTVPGPWESKTTAATIASGTISIPTIQPGESRIIKMELPGNFFDGDLLSITATDPFGSEIFTWTWPIRYAAQYLERKKADSNLPLAASVTEQNQLVTLSANGTTITFNSETGTIQNVNTGNGPVSLTNGPLPVGMKAKVVRHETRKENSLAIFTVWYQGGIDSIRWEMHPDGKMKMTMLALNNFLNDGGFDGGFFDDKVDLWGITFNIQENDITGVRWFGKGPYRVWKNRQRGQTINLWEKAYNNTITGESFANLIYPEFKGYHANTYWAKLSTKNEVPITFASESDGLFLHLLTPEEPVGRLKSSVPKFPEGNLSFLYEITPMHSFKPTSQMGPQSAPSSIRIKKGDEGISMIVWFDFNKQ